MIERLPPTRLAAYAGFMLVLEIAGGILLAWFVICGIRAAADMRDGR